MLHDIEHTLRASFFGFTVMLPLIAAGTVDAHPGAVEIAALMLAALNFHCFGYLHNDLVDLPLDRTEPQRANDPLVAGRLNATYVKWFVIAQLPISVAAVWLLDASAQAYGYLIAAYVAGFVYNVYGKRCPVPMLTDAVQGFAWLCFAAFGAELVAKPSNLSWVIALFGFAFIFLINGVHGGLRDLPNDLRRGRITTAIYLGARPAGTRDVTSTPALQTFAWIAFILLVLPSAYCLVTNSFHYDVVTRSVVSLLWLALTAAGAWYLVQVVKTEQTERRRRIYAHQLFLLAPPLVAFLPMLAASIRNVVLCVWVVTLVLFSERLGRVRTLLFDSVQRLMKTKRYDQVPDRRT